MYMNFGMTEDAFYVLCDLLRPYVDPQTTEMVAPVMFLSINEETWVLDICTLIGLGRLGIHVIHPN